MKWIECFETFEGMTKTDRHICFFSKTVYCLGFFLIKKMCRTYAVRWVAPGSCIICLVHLSGSWVAPGPGPLVLFTPCPVPPPPALR